jgi:hypothetical protein
VFLEEHVVVGVAVEGRVEVNEVDALVGDVAAHHVEVVAVVERVWLRLRHAPSPSSIRADCRGGSVSENATREESQAHRSE